MYTSSNVNIFEKLHTKYVYIINIHTFTKYAQENIQYITSTVKTSLGYANNICTDPVEPNIYICIYMHTQNA